MSTKRRAVVTKTDAEIDKTHEVPKTERLSRAEGTRSKHLEISIPVGVVVVVVILLVAVALVYRARRRKSNDYVHETTNHVLQPFLRIGKSVISSTYSAAQIHISALQFQGAFSLVTVRAMIGRFAKSQSRLENTTISRFSSNSDRSSRLKTEILRNVCRCSPVLNISIHFIS